MEALLGGDTPSDANLHIFEQNGLFLPCKNVLLGCKIGSCYIDKVKIN